MPVCSLPLFSFYFFLLSRLCVRFGTILPSEEDLKACFHFLFSLSFFSFLPLFSLAAHTVLLDRTKSHCLFSVLSSPLFLFFCEDIPLFEPNDLRFSPLIPLFLSFFSPTPKPHRRFMHESIFASLLHSFFSFSCFRATASAGFVLNE